MKFTVGLNPNLINQCHHIYACQKSITVVLWFYFDFFVMLKFIPLMIISNFDYIPLNLLQERKLMSPSEVKDFVNSLRSTFTLMEVFLSLPFNMIQILLHSSKIN